MCALGRDKNLAIGGALPTSSILGSPAIGGAALRSGRRSGTLLAGGQVTAGGGGSGGSDGGGIGGGGAKPRPPVMER